MERNRQPQNKSKHIWSDNFQQSYWEYTMEEKMVSPINAVGQTGYARAGEYNWTLICNISYAKINSNKDLKTWNFNTLGRKQRGKAPWHWQRLFFLKYDSLKLRPEKQIKQVGLHQAKMLLHSKGHAQQWDIWGVHVFKCGSPTFVYSITKKVLPFIWLQRLALPPSVPLRPARACCLGCPVLLSCFSLFPHHTTLGAGSNVYFQRRTNHGKKLWALLFCILMTMSLILCAWLPRSHPVWSEDIVSCLSGGWQCSSRRSDGLWTIGSGCLSSHYISSP